MLDIYTSKLRQNSFNTLASSLVLLDLYWSEPRRNFNREQAALLHLLFRQINELNLTIILLPSKSDSLDVFICIPCKELKRQLA